MSEGIGDFSYLVTWLRTTEEGHIQDGAINFVFDFSIWFLDYIKHMQ